MVKNRNRVEPGSWNGHKLNGLDDHSGKKKHTHFFNPLTLEGYRINVFFIHILIPRRARNNANGYTFWAWAICVKKSVIL